MFVFGGVSLIYICGLAVDLVRLCVWESVLACVYVYRFSALVCVCFGFCVSCGW